MPFGPRMKRLALVPVACSIALGLTACSGSTGQAEDVTDVTAKLVGKQLTAHNDGAHFYFHYCKTSEWPGCNTKTETRGPFPAGASGDWGEVVTGLAPNTSYTYEVCGYEQGTSLMCANDVQFTTKASTSINIRTVAGRGLCPNGPPFGEPFPGCLGGGPAVEGSPALDSARASVNVRPYYGPGGGYLQTQASFQGASGAQIGLVQPTGDPDGIITRFAGGGSDFAGEGINARNASLRDPEETTGLRTGGALIAEFQGCRIRYVTPILAGLGYRRIYTVAGNGKTLGTDVGAIPCPPDPTCITLPQPGKQLGEPMCGEDRDAIDATIPRPLSVSVARETTAQDGSTTVDFYIDAKPKRILKVTGLALKANGDINGFAPRAQIERVAGNGTDPGAACYVQPYDRKCPQAFSGDAPKPVDGVKLSGASFVRAMPGGGFAFLESCRIRLVKDGILSTLAGAGPYHGPAGQLTAEENDGVNPHDAGTYPACSYKLEGSPGTNDGYPANKARIMFPEYFDVTADGGIAIPSDFAFGIRYVAPPNENGRRIITTIAGKCVPEVQPRGSFDCDSGFDVGADDAPRPARGSKLAVGGGLAFYRRQGVNGFLIGDNNRMRFVEAPTLTPYQP